MFARVVPLVLLVSAVPAFAAAPVSGRWVTPDRDSVIEIGACDARVGGTKLCGRIARLLKPVQGGPAVDRNNPDVALRSRPILGLPILLDFTDASKEWRGRAYDPRTGKTYRSVLTLAPNGTLRFKGCVAVFCQTQEWRRAQ